ncbi:MAG: DUF4440 domain-containing protein [Gemmatimonadales bacterium]|jgi:uncharacterized protein (TIGR02246 family)
MRTVRLMLAAMLLALPSTLVGQDDGGAKAAIEAGDVAWQTAWSAGDAAAITALYADDAIVMAPGMPSMRRHKAIQAGLQVALDMAEGSQLTLTPKEIMAHGDMALDVGKWVETGADGSHKDHGKYIAVWKKIDGQWMLVRDIWNSSM